MKIIKYFFEFIIVISLFCIFKIIGLKNASNLGSIIVRSIGPLFRSKAIIKKNIETGLGNINEDRKIEIINGMWSNIGKTFAEYVKFVDTRIMKETDFVTNNEKTDKVFRYKDLNADQVTYLKKFFKKIENERDTLRSPENKPDQDLSVQP